MVVVTLAAAILFVAASINSQAFASPNVAVQEQEQIQTTNIEYAQLTIVNDQLTFEVGGTNPVPRTFTLNGLYRSLGGNQRASFVNLLGKLGEQGWQLVEISQDRSIYTFVR